VIGVGGHQCVALQLGPGPWPDAAPGPAGQIAVGDSGRQAVSPRPPLAHPAGPAPSAAVSRAITAWRLWRFGHGVEAARPVPSDHHREGELLCRGGTGLGVHGKSAGDDPRRSNSQNRPPGRHQSHRHGRAGGGARFSGQTSRSTAPSSHNHFSQPAGQAEFNRPTRRHRPVPRPAQVGQESRSAPGSRRCWRAKQSHGLPGATTPRSPCRHRAG